MAQEKPSYEVNEEFNGMAKQLVEIHAEKFNGIDIDKVCCVNTSKKRKDNGVLDRIWKVNAVKMPEAIHNRYGWYVILHADDWDELSEKHKLVLVADVLHGLPADLDSQGKVNSCDAKGYLSMFSTFGINFQDDPDIPHLINDEVEWK